MEELFKLPNVVMVYTGQKTVGGKKLNGRATVVGVTKKVPVNQLRIDQVIPPYYKGTVTDVVEVGEIKALRTGRYRPAPGGVSIGHKDITAGTLGMVARKQGRKAILSNAHVLANTNKGKSGDVIVQPGIYDGGSEVNDCIAFLAESVPIKFSGESDCPITRACVAIFNGISRLLGRKARVSSWSTIGNLVDAAIAYPYLDPDVLDEILEVGVPVGYGTVAVDDQVKKSGRTTGLTHGTVLGTDGVVNVNYGEEGIATFEDQLILSPMSEPGDSGSIILSSDDMVVGLLFAGSDQITIANKIEHVISSLELDV